MKKSKTQKGITLVALIITIIVLLILAVVTISAVQDGGIIRYAQNARTEYIEKADEENTTLQNYADIIEENNPNGVKDTLARKITAANYGDNIKYTANEISDWKIFYSDGKNVYIITSNYYVGISDEVAILTGMTNDTNNNGVSWKSAPESAQNIDSEAKTRFKANYSNYNTNANGRCVSTLLNTSNWEDFASGVEGAMAIGTPTLEMFVASYNAKSAAIKDKVYGTLAYEESTDGFGYKVSLNGGTMSDGITLTDDGKADSLYHLPESDNWTMGYRIASPSAGGADSTMQVSYGSVGSDWTYTYHGFPYALRPVVCLPSDYNATQNASGVWE